MDFSNFSNAEKQQMQLIVEQKQMKDFMRLYSGLVHRCFTDCINDFTSKKISGKEVSFSYYDSSSFKFTWRKSVSTNVWKSLLNTRKELGRDLVKLMLLYNSNECKIIESRISSMKGSRNTWCIFVRDAYWGNKHVPSNLLNVLLVNR